MNTNTSLLVFFSNWCAKRTSTCTSNSWFSLVLDICYSNSLSLPLPLSLQWLTKLKVTVKTWLRRNNSQILFWIWGVFAEDRSWQDIVFRWKTMCKMSDYFIFVTRRGHFKFLMPDISEGGWNGTGLIFKHICNFDVSSLLPCWMQVCFCYKIVNELLFKKTSRGFFKRFAFEFLIYI